MSHKSFDSIDYILFAIMLCVSTGIGIFFGCFSSKQHIKKGLLVGNGGMGIIPVSMSLFASFISSASLLGGPLEVYNYGIMFIWSVVGYSLSVFLAAKFFIPFFIELGYSSAYEYLEKRFNSRVKNLATFIFIIHTIFYLAFVLYGPAYAIFEATNRDMNIWVLVVIIGIVSTFYTTVGGMVTVMWTDVFQVIVLLVSTIIIAIIGIYKTNGVANIIELNWKFKRIYLNLKLDPTERHTIWSLTIGYSIQWLSIFGVNQSQVQRYLSASSIKVAKKSAYMSLVIYAIFTFSTLFIGMIIFASYNGCDRLNEAGEGLFARYVMDVMKDVSCVPGLFLTALFAAALSSISSGLNSLSAVTLESYVKNWLSPNIFDKKYIQISRILCVIYGLIIISFTYFAELLKNTLQAVLSLFSVTCGPILGVFILGLFFPFSNSNGALFGGIFSFLFSIFIFVTFYIFDNPIQKNVFNQNNCSIDIKISNKTNTKDQNKFPITYEWFGLMAVSIVLIIGSVISFITKPINLNEIDTKLVNKTALDWYTKFCNKIKSNRIGYSMPKRSIIKIGDKEII